MSEKYALPPALLIPKQRMHWATKALLGVGGLLVIQIAVVGLIAVKRDNDASAKLAEIEAQRQAAVIAATKPPEPVRAPVPAAMPKVVAAEAPVAKPETTPPASTKSSRAHGRSSRSHHARGASARDRKLLAALNGSKSSKPAPASAPSNRRSNDAIDEILKNFK